MDKEFLDELDDLEFEGLEEEDNEGNVTPEEDNSDAEGTAVEEEEQDAGEPAVEEETEPQESEELSDDEELPNDKDFVELLLEDPKEALKKVLEEDRDLLREVILDEVAQLQQQALEEQKKYQTFLEQKEELKKTYAPDFDEVLSDDVLQKIASDPEVAAEIYNAPNIAEKAYYFAKFGTTNPTLKQIESLVKSKSAPAPLGSGGKVEHDFEYLDPANVDFDD